MLLPDDSGRSPEHVGSNIICYTYCMCKQLVFNRISMFGTAVVCFSGSAAQRGLWPPRTTRFRDQTQRRATVGTTTLDE
jgi:hypothetical protein